MATSKELKKSHLAVRFGITLGIEIIALLALLGFLSVNRVKTQLEESYISSTSELLNAHATVLVQRNSKFMQQLRMYTMSDVVREKGSVEEIVDWLVAHRKIRSGDFNTVMFCDAETGIGYTDDGEQRIVKTTPYFKAMVTGGLKQYISDAFGDSMKDSQYFVCKQVTINKKNVGFFAAGISMETLSNAVNAIKVGESGFATLLRSDGLVMAYPEENVVMRNNFLNGDEYGYQGLTAVVQHMTNGETGAGWVTTPSNRQDLMLYQPVAGTPWLMSVSIPRRQVFKTAIQLQGVMALLTVVISFILILTSTLSVWHSLKPLQNVEKNIHEIASGNADLTQRMKVVTNNEIGSVTRGFNAFVEKLQSIMTDIKDSKSELAIAGDDLNASIEDTSNSINQILDNIDQVSIQITSQSASVDETAGAVNEIASNIESLKKMIETQSAGVTQASAAVEEMIGNISSVNQSVEKMAVSFEDLEQKTQVGTIKQREMNERIDQIEEQSKTLQEANTAIASIASQTNLLAMNAAIEAAHAGNAGRGFSVVADEIRKLSETSTAQSKKIGEQLKKIKDAIASVVLTSEETSATFNSVSESIQTTDQLVRQIRNAMAEQQQGSQQISAALHDMSDSTLEVRTASSEMSAGNQAILAQVRHLKDDTTTIRSSMNIMSDSARKIKETGAALNDISTKMKGSIDQIGSQIDTFQV